MLIAHLENLSTTKSNLVETISESLSVIPGLKLTVVRLPFVLSDRGGVCGSACPEKLL
jgi:hypothetical protein